MQSHAELSHFYIFRYYCSCFRYALAWQNMQSMSHFVQPTFSANLHPCLQHSVLDGHSRVESPLSVLSSEYIFPVKYRKLLPKGLVADCSEKNMQLFSRGCKIIRLSAGKSTRLWLVRKRTSIFFAFFCTRQKCHMPSTEKNHFCAYASQAGGNCFVLLVRVNLTEFL